MSKKLIAGLVVVLAILGGGVAVWFTLPNDGSVRLFKDSEPPTLFAKSDYKVEQRSDGQYIVIEKIGFSAKVPEGWAVEIEGYGNKSESGTAILNSENAEFKYQVVQKGCQISINANINEESTLETITEITSLKESATKKIMADDGYELTLRSIGTKDCIKYFTTNTNYPSFGYFYGITIPIDKQTIINAQMNCQKDFTSQCEPIWEGFINSMELK